MSKGFKQKVYKAFCQILLDKIALQNNTLDGLRDSSANETKSSAGDKYETGREMIRIEMDKISEQLRESSLQKATFENINIEIQSEKIIPGSLIKTEKGFLFLSVALGKINIDDITVTALSPQSPLGIRLTGLKLNDFVTINNITYTVQEIW